MHGTQWITFPATGISLCIFPFPKGRRFSQVFGDTWKTENLLETNPFSYTYAHYCFGTKQGKQQNCLILQYYLEVCQVSSYWIFRDIFIILSFWGPQCECVPELKAQSFVQRLALASHPVHKMCLAVFDGKSRFRLGFNATEMSWAPRGPTVAMCSVAFSKAQEIFLPACVSSRRKYRFSALLTSVFGNSLEAS